jgi:hypothetical protein
MFIRQSNATTIVLGPFVDSTDGHTPETGLSITQADVRLSKAAGAFAAKNDTSSATHMENGVYSIPLNATDTGTLGKLKVVINKETTARVVAEDYEVITGDAYNRYFSSSLGFENFNNRPNY